MAKTISVLLTVAALRAACGIQVQTRTVDPSVADLQKIASNHYLHSFLVSKNGQTTVRQYWKKGAAKTFDYETNLGGSPSNIHFLLSITKTMTGLSMARAVQLGYINFHDPIVKHLSKNVSKADLKAGTDRIKVEDLMRMRSGISIPAGLHSAFQGPEAILSDTAAVTPGKVYKYQDSDPQLLWHAMELSIPGGAHAFLEKEVFGPLGITGYEWKTDATESFTGGAGLSLKAEDMLKVGNLMADGGRLHGKQFVPYAYVEEAMSPVAEDDDYRMLWHHHASGGFSYSAGGGGQYICVDPKNKMVMVTTAADDELMQSGVLLNTFLDMVSSNSE